MMTIVKSNGETVAFCDKVNYIKIKPETGVYIATTPDKAQGIAVMGLPFNMPGHSEIFRDVFVPTEGGEEGEGTVERQVAPVAEMEFISEYDFMKLMEDKNGLQDEDITSTQLALCDVYEMLLG